MLKIKVSVSIMRFTMMFRDFSNLTEHPYILTSVQFDGG
jgi:hypothetical protein